MKITNKHYEYDLFISYTRDGASELADKLRAFLQQYGVRVWHDSQECKPGDDLANRIAHGIANSQLALVIANSPYFTQDWTKNELNTLVSLQIAGRISIIPLLHNFTLAQLQDQNPFLGSTVLLGDSEDLQSIAAVIITRLLQSRVLSKPTIDTYQAVFSVTPSPIEGLYRQTLYVNGVFRVPPGSKMLYRDKITGSSPNGQIIDFRSVPERYAGIDEQNMQGGLNLPFEIHGLQGSTTMQISGRLELTKQMSLDDGYVAFALPYDTRNVSIIFDYSGLEFEPTEFCSHVDSQTSESKRRAVAPTLTHWPERKTLVAHGKDLPEGSHPMIGWGRWVSEWRRRLGR